MSELKATVSKESSFDLLDIRLGRIIEAELEPTATKPSYRLLIDFGKFGRKVSIGRFTRQPAIELVGQQVVAVLNFEPRKIGQAVSEVLVLGVQVPGADSGEATILSPKLESKIGGKVF
jgi:tRNA-binding protein